MKGLCVKNINAPPIDEEAAAEKFQNLQDLVKFD